jgi:hypothetical protein
MAEMAEMADARAKATMSLCILTYEMVESIRVIVYLRIRSSVVYRYCVD